MAVRWLFGRLVNSGRIFLIFLNSSGFVVALVDVVDNRRRACSWSRSWMDGRWTNRGLRWVDGGRRNDEPHAVIHLCTVESRPSTGRPHGVLTPSTGCPPALEVILRRDGLSAVPCASVDKACGSLPNRHIDRGSRIERGRDHRDMCAQTFHPQTFPQVCTKRGGQPRCDIPQPDRTNPMGLQDPHRPSRLTPFLP
jgi:hypothetical protein